MIEVSELCKSYGSQLAVQGLSFSVARGEVAGFLGPNGAGKSTTLRIIAGFLGASSGRVSVAGHNVFDEPLLARSKLGYMPESCPLYPEMRVREYLDFRAAIKQVPPKSRAACVSKAMSLAAIATRSESIIGHLSKGYRQRLGLADALVADPELLILDEPTAGLDPNQIREVRTLIRDLSQEHTILLSTHILAEVEAACDRAIVIDAGRLVAKGTLAELRDSGAQGLEVILRVGEESSAIVDAGILTRTEIEPGIERWLLSLDTRSPEEWVRVLCAWGLGVRQLVPAKHSLEDVFSRLTRREPSTEARSG